MSQLLRDRLYGDTGLPVQGATVQAYLITGGGTDSGTGSSLTASTTTDVNGVWKFSGATLPDAGAGNWYDVKIINGQQVRWRYGNIQSAISALVLSQSFTVTSGNTWDFAAAVTKLSDPFITGQVTVGTGVQTLPTVTGNTGKWRFYKAGASSMTITPATGEALWAPAATAASAANVTYSSPAGESTDWYCNGTNWICI